MILNRHSMLLILPSTDDSWTGKIQSRRPDRYGRSLQGLSAKGHRLAIVSRSLHDVFSVISQLSGPLLLSTCKTAISYLPTDIEQNA